jgi:hypothetical protein
MKQLEYLSKNMSVSDALGVAAVSLIKATVCTAILVAIILSGIADAIIAQAIITFPYAVIPAIVITYISVGKKWGSTLLENIAIGIVSGVAIALLMRMVGVVIVMMIDIMGIQNTILSVVLESGFAVIWLYLDLKKWIKEDSEYKARHESKVSDDAARQSVAGEHENN